MYAKGLKRVMDFTLSLGALLILSPVLLLLTVIGVFVMGGNPFFVQHRPGKKDENGNETIFRLIKFRTMTDKRDENGNLLSDDKRLTAYGRFIRSTSLDELPELINIVKGDMSIVGPRPQLVRDMVFMSEDQRRRHEVRPGLTGLAQINGRNRISWEEKLQWDLVYLDKGVTLWGDLSIILKTVGKVLERSDTVREGTASDLDFGEWLVQNGTITEEQYRDRNQEALRLINV